MAKKLSMSVSNGKPGGRRHNVESEYRERLTNVAPERTYQNVILCDEPLREVYADLFGAATESYNANQKDPRYRIDDYFAKIKDSKQERLGYELVVQVGNKATNSAKYEDNRLGSAQVYRAWLKRFQEKFPQLHVYQAAIHMDEATPHLHVSYVPISPGNPRGLETKNSLTGAYKQMGYADVRDANKAMYSLLKEVAAEQGIERLDAGCHRARLDVRDFKALADEINLNEADKAFRDSPLFQKMVQLVIMQHQIITEQAKLVDKQSQTLNDLPQDAPRIGGARQLKEAIASARQIAEELKPHLDFIQQGRNLAVKAFKAIPEHWRDHILNPVPKAQEQGRRDDRKPSRAVSLDQKAAEARRSAQRGKSQGQRPREWEQGR